jgi:hypothetical protein
VVDPSLPAPAAWTTGEIVSAAVLRADVSDAVQLLIAQRPMFIGTQTTTAQSLTSGTGAAVTLDTELYDNWDGHLVTVDPAGYYPNFAGWYLCEGNAPLNYAGTTGQMSAGIGGVQNGGGLTAFYGQRIPNNAEKANPFTVKLMEIVNVGGGAGTGDYISLYAWESAGTEPLNNATIWPYLKVRWVAALSGTSGLSTPTNDAWVAPTSYVTSAFVNKNITNTINFLIYPPVMEYTLAGSASLASQSSVPATGTAIGCDTVTVDNYTAYSTSAKKWTAPVSGIYYCYAAVCMTMGSGGQACAAGLTVTSSNYFSGSTGTIWGGCQATTASSVQVAAARRRLRLNAGDTVGLAGFQHDSGGAAATVEPSSSWSPRLIIVWECA